MKISIIVPTRNGSYYLPHCLATCLAPEDKDLEIIVSDNSLGGETREAVAKISDSRLRYFNAGGNLSMRQNYEFALSKATGDYIIMIGDDDGVLKNGLTTLRFLIDKYRPDVINWRILRYIWPSTGAEPTEGIVNFRRDDFFGPLRHIDPKELLVRFCRAETVGYKDGANLYHGCVARPVIEALKKKTGEYFQAANPDMWASLANLTEAKSMHWIKNPVTIGGESEKSTGAISSKKSTPTSGEMALSDANWAGPAKADTVKPECDPSVRPITPFAYGILGRINRLVCNGALSIDHERWRAAVLKDLEALPPEERAADESAIQTLFSETDPVYQKRPLTFSSATDAHAAAVQREQAKKMKVRRRKVAAEHTRNVAALAHWIDTVSAPAYHPSSNPRAAAALQVWKIINMNIKASTARVRTY